MGFTITTGSPARGEFQRDLLGLELRPFISARSSRRCRPAVVSVAFPLLRHSDAAHRAGVNHALHAALAAPPPADCAFPPRSIGIARTDPSPTGGNPPRRETPPRNLPPPPPSDAGSRRSPVTPLHSPVRAVAGRTHQRTHRVPREEQFSGDMPPNKPGRAGNQSGFHERYPLGVRSPIIGSPFRIRVEGQ